MLSEELQRKLRSDVAYGIECGMLDHLQRRGPTYLLSDRFLVQAKPENAHLVEEVRSNRPEAERFLAGLIGMM
jgi:hypothetical protein